MQQYLNPPQEAPFMKNATFYLLDNDTTVDGLSAVEQLVCEISAERWRGGERVEIAWQEKLISSPRDILISLRTRFADFATAFTEVLDVVPY